MILSLYNILLSSQQKCTDKALADYRSADNGHLTIRRLSADTD